MIIKYKKQDFRFYLLVSTFSPKIIAAVLSAVTGLLLDLASSMNGCLGILRKFKQNSMIYF